MYCTVHSKHDIVKQITYFCIDVYLQVYIAKLLKTDESLTESQNHNKRLAPDKYIHTYSTSGVVSQRSPSKL